MASLAYTPAKTKLASGEIDLAAGGDDIRVILVMSNTTADTEEDKDFVGDLTTLDQYDGANESRKALANEAVNEDAANDRAEFDADDITWTALGVGTRQAVGMVVFKFVTNDADSPLIAYIDTGGFPFDGNGGDVTITWNAQGILQVT